MDSKKYEGHYSKGTMNTEQLQILEQNKKIEKLENKVKNMGIKNPFKKTVNATGAADLLDAAKKFTEADMTAINVLIVKELLTPLTEAIKEVKSGTIRVEDINSIAKTAYECTQGTFESHDKREAWGAFIGLCKAAVYSWSVFAPLTGLFVAWATWLMM